MTLISKIKKKAGRVSKAAFPLHFWMLIRFQRCFIQLRQCFPKKLCLQQHQAMGSQSDPCTLPWGKTQTQATEGGGFLYYFTFFSFTSQLLTATNAAVSCTSITGDEDQPAAPHPRGADISNRDRCCCKQTAGPHVATWKGGRKTFAVSSAWLSVSPRDGFLYFQFCCRGKGMFRVLGFAGVCTICPIS